MFQEHILYIEPIKIIYSPWETPVPSLVDIKQRGQKIMRGQHIIYRLTTWPWPLTHATWKSLGIIYPLRATSVPSLVDIKQRDQKILSGQHMGSTTDRQSTDWPFDLDLRPCDLKINRDHLLSKGNSLYQGLVDIEQRGQKILSGQHMVYRPWFVIDTLTSWPWPLTMWRMKIQ